jgi:glutaredoxin
MNVDSGGKPGSRDQNNPPFPGRGMLAAIIGIIVLVIIAGYIMAGSPAGGAGVIPPQTCAQKAIAYVNANLIEAGSTAEVVSVKEINGVYEITTRYRGNSIPLYATKDCSLLFTNSYPITSSAISPAQTAEAPVKSGRPEVELYVMSFCPYGVQMENAMRPVAELLSGSTDIRVRYIATVPDESITTAQSLHGNAEAVEDVRQLCIASLSADKYWYYLAAFNAQCYPVWMDAGKLGSCQRNVTASLGLSQEAIDRCSGGSEGLSLLKADSASAERNRATASPTLIINGQRYTGARNPEALKKAICEHFETPPQSCNTPLSSQSSSAAGNC